MHLLSIIQWEENGNYQQNKIYSEHKHFKDFTKKIKKDFSLGEITTAKKKLYK